jgi:hypothetical protein
MSDSTEKDEISIGTALKAAVKSLSLTPPTPLFTPFIPEKLCSVSNKKEPFLR